MKKEIQWAAPSTTPTDLSAPAKQVSENQPKFVDAIHLPKFLGRKQRFNQGITWLRFLPAIAGSKLTWMAKIDVYEIGDASWVKPDFGHDLVFEVKQWLRKNAPQKLWNREVGRGYKLWEKPTGVAWAIDTTLEEGKRLLLFRASLYDGERGGTTGLGYQIHSLANQVDNEPGSPTVGQLIYGDITAADAGRLVKVEKSPTKAGEYASYRVAIGSQPAPLSRVMEALTEEEYALLCPIEQTIRQVTIEEQAAFLRAHMGADFPEEVMSKFTGPPARVVNEDPDDQIPM